MEPPNDPAHTVWQKDDKRKALTSTPDHGISQVAQTEFPLSPDPGAALFSDMLAAK